MASSENKHARWERSLNCVRPTRFARVIMWYFTTIENRVPSNLGISTIHGSIKFCPVRVLSFNGEKIPVLLNTARCWALLRVNARYRVLPCVTAGNYHAWVESIHVQDNFRGSFKKGGNYIHLVVSNGLIMYKNFEIINRLKLMAEYMVSKTGKTHVANNSIGIYGQNTLAKIPLYI